MNYEDLIHQRNTTNIFAKFLGIETVAMDEGYAKAVMVVNENLFNSNGTVHGGALFSLADIVSGSAANSREDKVATLDATVHYLASGFNIEKIIGEAKEVKKGRTIRIYDVQLFDDNEKLLLKGLFSYFVLQSN